MKQLQIVVGQTSADTHIYVDNQPISWIQEIKFSVGVENKNPEVEIVFPDLRRINATLAKKVQEQVMLLSDLPQVKVTLKHLEPPK